MDFYFFKTRKGSLLQTLLMCIVMASISVMIMKWVLMRYSMSNRINKSVQAKARVESVFYNRMSGWNYVNAPANFNTTVDGKSISATVAGGNRITLTSDEDQ